MWRRCLFVPLLSFPAFTTMQTDLRPHPLTENAEAASRTPLWLRLAVAVGLSAFFFVVYGQCNAYAARLPEVPSIHFGWERNIPVIPWMIVPYWSLDAFFFVAPLLCAGRELWRHALRIVAAIAVAGVFFVLFPLKFGFERPVPEGVFGPLFKLLHSFDQPHNLAPSLHLALRTIVWPVFISRTRGGLQLALKAWFVLIGLSTLFTWQHHLIDLVTGQFLGIACLYLIPDRCAMTRTFPQRNYRLGATYGGGAVGMVLLAALAWPWGAMALWPGVVLGILSAGYFGVGARVFRKSAGRIPNSARWMLAPYFAVAYVCHRWHQRRASRPREVSPGVWMGPRLAQGEAVSFLRQYRIGAVLDLTAERTEPRAFRDNPEVVYLNIPLLDLAEPTPGQLDTARAFVREYRERGVYVHCMLGVYRSVRIVEGCA